jgi:hypothetical protein
MEADFQFLTDQFRVSSAEQETRLALLTEELQTSRGEQRLLLTTQAALESELSARSDPAAVAADAALVDGLRGRIASFLEEKVSLETELRGVQDRYGACREELAWRITEGEEGMVERMVRETQINALKEELHAMTLVERRLAERLSD